MKNSSAPRFALLTTLFVIGHSSFVIAQGSLTPPGAPGPTMKTLDQLEARTPISSAPFTISASGSYYLAGHLAVASGTAITISADDVTLDLNGFTIASTASPASGDGVNVAAGRQNVTIRNGHIKGTTTFGSGVFSTGGFLNGISSATATRNVRVSGINVRGVGDDGINLSTTGVASLAVDHCTVTLCAGDGIRAGLVHACGVETAGGFGIRAGVVRDCFATSVSTVALNGIDCDTADNCRGVATTGMGVNATTAANCVATSTSGTGLTASDAVNCYATTTSGATGLIAGNATNCHGLSGSGTGLSATNAMNCVGNTGSGPFGLTVSGTANGCRGVRSGGTAISAGIAIGCTVSGGGTVAASIGKFLGTP